jgi:phage baseplate assembly protein W
MPTYIGFSTQDVNQPTILVTPGAFGGTGNIIAPPRLGKKFTLVDGQLVIRDLLNALSIKQGDKVGQPTYGTTLWSYVFEPESSETRGQVEDEIRRVITEDPRIVLNSVGVYYQDNGILIEIEMAVNTFNNAVQFGLFLNRFDGSIQQLAR